MMSQNKSNCLHANYSWIIKSSGHYTKCMVTWGQIQAGREHRLLVLLTPDNKQMARCYSWENKAKETWWKGEQSDAPNVKGGQNTKKKDLLWTKNFHREWLQGDFRTKLSKGLKINRDTCLRWPKCSHE